MSRGNDSTARSATQEPYYSSADYPDDRSTDVLARDREAVRRQLDVLLSRQHTTMDVILSRMADRQDNAPSDVALPFDRYPPGADPKALVARGQLVVRVAESHNGNGSLVADNEIVARVQE